MIKDSFLVCQKCTKKIQPVSKDCVIVATVYCSNCKTYFEVIVADGEIFKELEVII